MNKEHPTVSVIHVVDDHVESPLRRVELHVVCGVGDDETHPVSESRPAHSCICDCLIIEYPVHIRGRSEIGGERRL